MQLPLAVLVVALVALAGSVETFARNDGLTVFGPRLYSGRPWPVPGGVFSRGGPELRYLAPGASRWKTLLTEPGGKNFRLAFDGARVLAAWKERTVLHQVFPESGKHSKIDLPGATQNTTIPDIWLFQVSSIKIAPNGRDALVYMIRSGLMHVAFRVALDGRFEPQQLFPITKGYLLHSSSRGAVLAVPGEEKRSGCGKRDCLKGGARIIAYDISDRRVRKRTLFRDEDVPFRSARAVTGGDDGNAVIKLGLARQPGALPPGPAILRYRYGDAKASFKQLSPRVGGGLRPVRWSTMSPSRNAFLHIVETRAGLAVRIQPLTRSGQERTVLIPTRYRHITEVYGFGARPDGSVWIHWDDELIILDAQDVARSVNLKPILGEGVQWAGVDIYAGQPESLWIGIEMHGKGRNYTRVNFAEVERKARPWPAASAMPRSCEKLPDVATLQRWRVYRETPCHGGAQNPMAKPHIPYEVYKLLPDGTKIVDGRELGCIRVKEKGCFKRCLPPDTEISTPGGQTRIDALRVGMPVWTRDRDGNKVAAKIVQTNVQQVPATHEMVRIRLADGRALMSSSGHPDTAGHGLERLKPGQDYDGSEVVETSVAGYDQPQTFDILPSGETGIYWANGIAVGSTLRRRRD